MDFLAHIQMMRVPLWARIIIYGGFTLIVSVCVFLAWRALSAQAPESWLGASFALFAAVFPLMIIILIATTVHTGEKAIADHTDRFLIKTIPSILARIPEDVNEFAAFYPRYRSGRRRRFATVEVSHRRGDCFADYRISFNDGQQRIRALIRVELNVRRMNFNLYLPLEALSEILGETKLTHEDGLTIFPLKRSVFKHTLEAASKRAVSSDEEQLAPGVYTFHEQIFKRTLEGTEWCILVGSSSLPKDLLWNPAERLFVAQDLMFMLRAFMSEGRDLFIDA